MKRIAAFTIAIVGASTAVVLAFNVLNQSHSEVGDTGEFVENSAIEGGGVTESGPSVPSVAAISESLASILKINEQMIEKLDAMDTRLSRLEEEKAEADEQEQQAREQRELLSKARKNPKLVNRYNDVIKQSREKRDELIGKQFDAEGVDPEWSEDAEERLMASFAENLQSQATLNDVECRSSMCRVELGLSGELDSSSFMELELQLLSEMASGEGGQVQAHHWIEDDGVGGLRYITYATRSSRRLPTTPDPFAGMTVEEAIEFLESQEDP